MPCLPTLLSPVVTSMFSGSQSPCRHIKDHVCCVGWLPSKGQRKAATWCALHASVHSLSSTTAVQRRQHLCLLAVCQAPSINCVLHIGQSTPAAGQAGEAVGMHESMVQRPMPADMLGLAQQSSTQADQAAGGECSPAAVQVRCVPLQAELITNIEGSGQANRWCFAHVRGGQSLLAMAAATPSFMWRQACTVEVACAFRACVQSGVRLSQTGSSALGARVVTYVVLMFAGVMFVLLLVHLLHTHAGHCSCRICTVPTCLFMAVSAHGSQLTCSCPADWQSAH